MQEQRGNFLLQVLLALTLVFAFMPFIANRLASRDMSAKMYAAKTSVESLHNAARIYARENKDTFVCASENNPTTYSDTGLRDLLEPYGLPKGFVPTTALNQNLSLQIVHKMREGCNDTENKTVVDIVVSRGDLSQYQLAELARMIGFFARAEGDIIRVNVPVDVIYSDIVRRRETNEQIGFLTDLEMGGCNDTGGTPTACNNIHNINTLVAERGNLNRAKIKMLALLGDGLNSNQNVIKEIYAESFNFKGMGNTAALNVRGDVAVNTAKLKRIKSYQDPSSGELFEIGNLSISAGGDVKGLNLYTRQGGCSGDADCLEYGSFSATPVGSEYQTIELNIDEKFSFLGGKIDSFQTVIATNIHVYPVIDAGATSAVANKNRGLIAKYFFIPEIDITNNPDGTDVDTVATLSFVGPSSFDDIVFVMPDTTGSDMQNYYSGEIGENVTFSMNFAQSLEFPKNPTMKILDAGNTLSCAAALKDIFGTNLKYDDYSLMQNVLCQYLYLTRMERRINHVLCCLDGSCDECNSLGNEENTQNNGTSGNEESSGDGSTSDKTEDEEGGDDNSAAASGKGNR